MVQFSVFELRVLWHKLWSLSLTAKRSRGQTGNGLAFHYEKKAGYRMPRVVRPGLFVPVFGEDGHFLF